MKKFFKALLIILMVLAYLFTMVVAVGLGLLCIFVDRIVNYTCEQQIIHVPDIADGWLVISYNTLFWWQNVSLGWLTPDNEIIYIEHLYEIYGPGPGGLDFHTVVNNYDGSVTLAWDRVYPLNYDHGGRVTFNIPAEIEGQVG